jgi:hypothetical protein
MKSGNLPEDESLILSETKETHPTEPAQEFQLLHQSYLTEATSEDEKKSKSTLSNQLIITVVLLQPDKDCCAVSDHIAAFIDDPDTIKAQQRITMDGRFVVNFGFNDNELGTGITQRLNKVYPTELRVQLKVNKDEKNTIEAFKKAYMAAGYFPYEKNKFHIVTNNCSRAVDFTLNYFFKEPMLRVLQRAASKAIFGFFTGCSCCGSCSRCIPTGPFLSTPNEIYKKALAIGTDLKKNTGPITETMYDGNIESAKNDAQRYKGGCIW